MPSSARFRDQRVYSTTLTDPMFTAITRPTRTATPRTPAAPEPPGLVEQPPMRHPEDCCAIATVSGWAWTTVGDAVAAGTGRAEVVDWVASVSSAARYVAAAATKWM